MSCTFPIRVPYCLFLVVFAALLLALGCASAGVQSSRRLVPESAVHRPPLILIYDFAVSEKDVVVDRLGPEFASGEADPEARAVLGREVANVFSEAIVAELRERGIDSEHAARSMKPPLHALLLKGEFLSVDEGDSVARMTIGFGAGKSEVRVRGHVFQQTENGAKLLSVAEVEASGSKMPGMLVPVGIGASLGNAARSAVINHVPCCR